MDGWVPTIKVCTLIFWSASEGKSAAHIAPNDDVRGGEKWGDDVKLWHDGMLAEARTTAAAAFFAVAFLLIVGTAVTFRADRRDRAEGPIDSNATTRERRNLPGIVLLFVCAINDNLKS
jgi:hypothetical protein